MDRFPSVGSGSSTGEHFHPYQERFTLSVFVTFCRYQNCVWIPSLLVFIVATGVSRKNFVDPTTAPATAAQIFSFGAIIAGYMIPWSALSSDYTAYFHPRVPGFVELVDGLRQNLISKKISWRVFVYSYLGLTIPIVRGKLACLESPLTTYRLLCSASARPQQFLPLLFPNGKLAILTVTSVDF
jgi:hypothetical protein